ncbi:MAG: sn-glycerol-3-phosphate ABC transporter ATP-binding protein UgpC [SAR324 cluster bacterium]|nr:sn-glycerol-3-phosphate ABC transporter ATP-binding protein UgpC [SAR324 cluster bacterium]
MATVNLNKVVKAYGDVEIVHGIDLDVKDEDFVVLLGPSGCGKSTTLRMVAGLEDITGGEIKIGDRVVNDVAPKDRKIAMVFQNYALYPHMTVAQNMAFGLKLQKMPKPEIQKKVDEVAKILELGPLLDRRPAALSGGQRQRVAMGRAMVRTPEVFLFDEPLSNLDAKLRTHMRLEIQKLHQQLKTTTLYVTHDQIEAMTLADQIVILRDGYIEQIGSPKEVFANPNNIFVATFIGSPAMNLIPMKTKNAKNGLVLESDSIKIPLPEKENHQVQANMDVLVGIRPTDINLAQKDDGIAPEWKFDATVEVTELLGAEAILDLKVGAHEIMAQIEGKDMPERKTKIQITFNTEAFHVFDKVSEKSIF